MLNDKAVLIVEENIFVALDLSHVVEDLKGHVVGPVASAAEALHLLRTQQVAAAMVNCDLVDVEVAEIVMLLADKNIPVVMHTAVGPPAVVRAILPDAPVLREPIQPRVVVARLVAEIAKQLGDEERH